MPTPIGHALAGLAIAGAGSKASGRRSGWHVAVLMTCAAAPDLDLALRLVDGASHHRGASHSFAAAAIVGLVGFLLVRFGVDLPGAGLLSAAWASHVVLDYFGLDTTAPIGEMALWPFSGRYFASPVSIFYDVPRSFEVWAIRHNIQAVALETAILAPLALICWRRSAR